MIIIKKYKLLTLIGMVILVSTSICGCKNNSVSEKIELSTDDISTIIKDNIVFKDELQKIDDKSMLQKLYSDINISNIKEFSVYTSASGATAEEIAVFKLNKNIYAEDVKYAIEKRKILQITNFENYVPEEVYKIKNSIIDSKDDIVVYVACDTPDDVEPNLEKLYNK